MTRISFTCRSLRRTSAASYQGSGHERSETRHRLQKGQSSWRCLLPNEKAHPRRRASQRGLAIAKAWQYRSAKGVTPARCSIAPSCFGPPVSSNMAERGRDAASHWLLPGCRYEMALTNPHALTVVPACPASSGFLAQRRPPLAMGGKSCR